MIHDELRSHAIDAESAAHQVLEQVIIVRDQKPGKDLDQWRAVVESLSNLAHQTERLRQAVATYLDNEVARRQNTNS
jgi:hypothetical protein